MLKSPGFASLTINRRVLIMPGKAAKITISERQQEILRTLCNAPTAPSQFRQRAGIILLAFDGLGNPDIAAQVGLS
jgi:putative transposase